MHVDDDPSIRDISKLMLMDLDSSFDIDNACCVDEAYKKLSTEHYDIIISDYEMPLKNGLEFLKELREQKNDIAFIIFTGRGREDVAVKALNLGADSYINKNGSPETVYCELADAINKTVERKKSRELLAKSESKYHSLVENSLQGIAILLASPIRIVFANSALGKILDYSFQELTSLSPEGITGLVHHEDRAVFFKRMENRLLGEPAEASFEFRAVRKDGSIIWLSSLANRVDYDGQPALQGMFLDVTESKKAAEILSESEQKYRELANCLPDIVFETNLNGQVEFANQRAAEISGYSHDEIARGLNIFQFIVPEDRDRATKNIQRLLVGGSYVPSEYNFARKDGTTFPALITATPRICKNKITGFRGMVLDISERKNAETLLKEAKSQLELQIERMPIACIFWDKSLKVVSWNPAAETIFGYSAKDIIGKYPFGTIVPKEAQLELEKIWHRLLQGDETAHSINDNLTKDGKRITCSWTNTPLKRDDNSVIGVLSMVQDITESKKAEKLLEKERSEFRNILDSAPVMIAYKSKDDHFVRVNSAFADFAGLPKEKIVGMTTFDLVKEQDVAQQGRDHDLQVMRTEVPVLNQMVKWSGLSSQKEIWALYSKLPFHDAEGNVVGTVSYVLDVDDRKKAEQAIIESEKNYRSLINGMSDAVWVVNFDGNFVDVNDAAVKVLGYSRDELLSFGIKDVDKYLTPEQAKAIMSRVASIGIQSFETVHTAKDGTEIPVEIISSQITYRGKPAVLGIARNISERKKEEKELKESEEKYNALFEQAGDYTLILEAQSTGVPIIFDANSSAPQIHGYTREEIIGKPITFLDKESSNDSVMDRLDKLLNNEKLVFETKHRRKDGSTIDVEVSIKKVKVGSKNLLVSVERDITERKKNENTLRQERGMLESVTKNIGAGLVMISKDYRILWMNDYLRQFGDALEGNICFSSFNTCKSICPNCGPKKVFKGADFDRREYCNQIGINKDRPVWFELIATPIKDKAGNVVAALELTVNITAKKEAEKKLKENSDKMDLMNEKLRVVGSLTRHDVANKLMAAKLNVYLLKKKLGENVELAKYFDGIESAFNGSDRIFEFSRLYEKIGAEKPSKENVFECFNQAAALMPNLCNVKILNECQGLQVVADSLLKQLFYNFIDNSLKHGEKVTQIRLHYTEDKNGVKLFYEDNGVGVLEVNKPKLFEVGFTTGKGTGLGLYLVKKMMDVYGWEIKEIGEPGSGAKFTITIPKIYQN